ncbi:trypsin-like peptidase domain-containing protein [Streptomyces sp. NRRL S-118]|uniref:VMAP-C domain-containing protein n=1 Tax=Streptomyces sp. NRRL S-118 TaxID=1463881 RepID=UPI0004C5E0A7|nr:trypsin-like peptidase domain-containing protein [Streptomyces sp. NRRL S-118]
MTWFRRPAAAGSRVSLLYEGSAKAAGAAALLSPRRVLTCAHVVNDALGRDLHCAEHPAPAGPLTVALRGSAAPGGGPAAGDGTELGAAGAGGTHRVTATVSVWVPPQPRPSALEWEGDLAVLDLDEPAPSRFRPVVWRDMEEGQELRAWHGGGEAITFADIVVGFKEGRYGYLDGPLSGAAVGPGYSGGPLWTRDASAVAGLVVAHLMPPGAEPLGMQQAVRRSWAVPWQAVREELARAGAADVLEECAVAGRPGRGPWCGGPETPRAAAAFVPVLRALLDDPRRRADHARALAAGLGYTAAPGSGHAAPTVEELAELLVTEERALATLTESLAPAVRSGADREALNSLLALGRLERCVRLLSVGEHRLLLEDLRRATAADATLVPRAAREALRYMALPGPLGASARLAEGDLDAVVPALEGYPDGPSAGGGAPPVPALLRLAAFVASAAPDRETRDSLHGWCDRVAHRLGISPVALAERRADAANWAAQRPSPVSRVVLRLTPGAPDAGGAPGADGQGTERYRCRISLVRKDGTTTTVAAPEGTCAPDEIGRLVREAAEGGHGDDAYPLTQVDVVVGRDGLQLAVDGWDTGNALGDLFPGLDGLRLALGAKYRVALRCPEMSRRSPRREAEMRRRWAAGDPGVLVVDETCATLQQLYQRLETSHKDVAGVVLHGPREERDRLLDLCLALGVPVVLWDREADGHGHAARLDALAPAGPLHGLPERVREFRAGVYGATVLSEARPALVWEDAELPVPGSLELLDPS